MQPTVVENFAQSVVVMDIPEQNDSAMRKMETEGLKLFVELFRPLDSAVSPTKIPFTFLTHEKGEVCPFCTRHPDRAGGLQRDNGAEFRKTGKTRPGNKRRLAPTQGPAPDRTGPRAGEEATRGKEPAGCTVKAKKKSQRPTS